MDKNLTYTFNCFGHPNIRATHPKTLEFTKDRELTERGDCIVGVAADFDLSQLKKFSGKIKVSCWVNDLVSTFKCKVNPEFHSDHELVLRKSGFQSERTFGLGLNRGANHLERQIVELMQSSSQKMVVEITTGWQ